MFDPVIIAAAMERFGFSAVVCLFAGSAAVGAALGIALVVVAHP